ncbi:MAG: L-threonylcarbamoyladenylate synthase [Chloroflexota bacterium]|nr:L-threonylcarbamoyladenylate synthase [Chloroflexota bacterium]
MKTEIIHTSSDDALPHAVEILKNGGLVAFPTDTVYGLAAFPWDADGVARLYTAKQRPLGKPIPLLLSDAGLLSRIAALPPHSSRQVKQLIARFWPGGLTLVLPKTAIVPGAISPGPTVAVRVPNLPLARELIREAGGVLAVTSANVSGQPSPITAQEVEAQLGGRIELILDGGPCRGGIPSSLLDCTHSPPLLLRRGAISGEDLQAAIGSINGSE